VLALASAIFLGFAAVVVLDMGEPGPAVHSRPAKATPAEQAPSSAALLPSSPADVGQLGSRSGRAGRRQDPQDRPGSAAARRTSRALRTHRALQHVPYRRGEVAIALVGARNGQAVLRVSAPNIAAARRGWRAYLRRYRDDGRAYLPRFRGPGDARG
jgi:hypothetical protein